MFWIRTKLFACILQNGILYSADVSSLERKFVSLEFLALQKHKQKMTQKNAYAELY